MKIEIIPCLKDNYAYVIIDEINKINLNIKNLYSELGIFLIQK